MTYFLGNVGNVRLKRNNNITLSTEVKDADVTPALNRVGIEGAADNLFTGDRITVATEDARGLIFFNVNAWPDGLATQPQRISAFVNVNPAGGLRFFRTFADAVNNVRTAELQVASFAGAAVPVTVAVNSFASNILGSVSSYEFNTDREALDTTSLSDKFRNMYSAGIITGSGSIDCFFDTQSSGLKEAPLLALQLIHRVDIGSQFDCLLSITDSENDPDVEDIYYETSAIVTRSGLQVTATDVITCRIDFVTTGEIQLRVGRPSGYILKEDNDRITLNQDNLAYLLQEVED
jgi:hypothetical protein